MNTLPWQITLGITVFLFFLAPFFRKWIDLVVWPKIVDWWAARSQARLKKQIARLQNELEKALGLPLLTVTEFTIASMIKIVCTSMAMFAYLLISAIWASDTRPLGREIAVGSFWLSVVVFGFLTNKVLRESIDSRTERYRKELNRRIEQLEAKLISI